MDKKGRRKTQYELDLEKQQESMKVQLQCANETIEFLQGEVNSYQDTLQATTQLKNMFACRLEDTLVALAKLERTTE